ncbi:MAG: hypothetical protein N3D74_05415 [Caldisericia bacterium]|nr:hypothetical protein [Caldisericia bacterium]
MDKKGQGVFTFFMIFFSILTVFFIFTAGTDKSPFRKFTDNIWVDIFAALLSGATVLFMSFYYSMLIETKGFEEIIRLNIKKIKKLKEKGWSDENIAKDILKALNLKRGYRYNYAYRKLIYMLGKIDKIKLVKDEES